MKHYTSNNEIYAFESDGSQDHLIKDDMRPITLAEIQERNKPTPEQLAAQLPAIRYAEESKGVNVNLVRYAGDESNRQALREALDMATELGFTSFPTWKDSDGNYMQDHPVLDVKEALIAIGMRRSGLIGLEGLYVAEVLAGNVTDLNTLDWTL